MQTRRLPGTGLVVSRLGLGTMTWGRETAAEDAAEQLAAFRAAGGTLVDTADRYAGGAGEHLLGDLLVGSARHELVLASKAGAATPLGSGGSRRHLLASLDASLSRLRVDHLDLWQVHGWDVQVPLEETLAAVDAAVASGRVRYAGVSGYAGWQVATAAAWQRAWPGRAPLATVQVEYSLLNRDAEADVLPAAEHHRLGVLAFAPLARGVLTGKYRQHVPADSRAASPAWRDYLAPYLDQRSARVVDAVATAADGLGVPPLAVALSWVRDRPGVTATIAGARTARQLADVLAAEQLALPEAIRGALDDVSG